MVGGSTTDFQFDLAVLAAVWRHEQLHPQQATDFSDDPSRRVKHEYW
jgi:hypothetical protein